MGKNFNVKFRTNCVVCGALITANRYRSYCSTQCRNRFYNRKYYKLRNKQADIKRGLYAPNKIRCLICGKWYYKICSHVYYKHNMTGREYRKMNGLDVKRGLLPDYMRQIMAEHVVRNGTIKNLKAGKKNWFKPGDKKAGRYERSAQTMERLKLLSKYKKNETISNRI